MPSESELDKYQTAMAGLLRSVFGEAHVIKEWDVAKHSQDDFTRHLYCPRVDIGVGPFNVTRDVENNVQEINHVCE